MDAAGPVDAQNAPTGPWITADGYPRAPTAIHGYEERSRKNVRQPQGGPDFGITGGPDFVDKRNVGTTGILQVDLSTTRAAPDGLSAIFADNLGADRTTVFNGQWTIATTNNGMFDLTLNFTTPFLYNPSNGNLLLDVRNFGGGTIDVPNSIFVAFDAQNTAGDTTSRAYSGSLNGVTLTTGIADTLGLVTRFTADVLPLGGAGGGDSAAPVITCASPDGFWHSNNISLACDAQDAGIGLANPADASFTLTTSVAAGTETANALTGTRQVCDGANNCATAGPIAGNMIDRKAPTITCASPDGAWHSDNIHLACTAQDASSGLLSPADATFTLSTQVPPNTAAFNAATDSRQVCDKAGNCATAGPITGNQIDRKPPVIAAPPNLTVPQAQSGGTEVWWVTPAVTDSETSASPAVCAPPPGSLFTVGTSTVTCTATDFVGNTGTVSFDVTVTSEPDQIRWHVLAGFLTARR